MFNSRSFSWMATAVGLALCTGPASLAGESVSDEVKRLEGIYNQQQRELKELQQLVSSQQNADADAARAAQMREEIRSILKEADFQQTLMQSAMTAGYDKGFFIRSADNKFSMKFNGLLQLRYIYYEAREVNRYLSAGQKRDDRSGFEASRVRLGITGNVSDGWTYYVNMQSEAGTRYDTQLETAWLNYRFEDAFQIRSGVMNTWDTRTGVCGDTEFVNHGIFNELFHLGYGIGVMVWGKTFDKRLDYSAQLLNGLSNGGRFNRGRVITPDPAELDGNPALVARAVWHALGDKPGTHFSCEGDLEGLQSPALDLGVHYAFTDNNNDNVGDTNLPVNRQRPYGIEGGFGKVTSLGLQFHQLGADVGWKWNGWSLYGEYVVRLVDVRRGSYGNGPLAPWFLASGDASTTAQHGAYVQTGWLLPIPSFEKKLEVVARVGGISVLSNGVEGTWEYAGGLNYYIDGSRVRLQGEVLKEQELPGTASRGSFANVNDDALIFRLQMTVSF